MSFPAASASQFPSLDTLPFPLAFEFTVLRSHSLLALQRPSHLYSTAFVSVLSYQCVSSLLAILFNDTNLTPYRFVCISYNFCYDFPDTSLVSDSLYL